MPANSQTFTFTYDDNGATVTNSAMSHNGDSTTVFGRVSNKLRGDGYYGRADGLHTISWNVENFHGSISVQGTLETDPIDSDWFTVDINNLGDFVIVDTTGALVTGGSSDTFTYNGDTITKSFNFKANVVWIRVKIFDWTDGTVNSVILNH
jgi:hypothetical protein